MVVSRKIVLRFPKRIVERPILYRLVKDYDLEINILQASISPEKEGLMVMELKGSQQQYDKGVQFLMKTGVKIQALSQDVTRNEEKCTHCGACITICPTQAFELDTTTRQVKFFNEKCIACGICIKGCPPRAMELHF
ncbi:NIL domain-containing protein [Chloroflexota bacterium]